MNRNIIDPVDTSLLKSELTPDRLLRVSNRGGNEIYVVDAFNAPNVMREIGRLREISFREGGGGTGKECDIDEFDTMTPPCRQLLVWDPAAEMIIGGYRYITGSNIHIDENGAPRIATSHMFHFSERFKKEFLPHTIELGRSFVRPEYQSTRAGSKGVYALDNLWDGLGALTVIHPEIQYFFGKVTMYPSYRRPCRDMILYFLRKHFPDRDELVRPIEPLDVNFASEDLHNMFSGETFLDDYKILNSAIRSYGINIPPLVNAYMSLSPSMKVFGTAVNHEFGEVEETGIFIAVNEIIESKKKRHIESFHPDHLLQ